MSEISSELTTEFNEGIQHEEISSYDINQLFKALEEIRKKFQVTMTGDYAKEETEFDTEVTDQFDLIDNQYIENFKDYIEEVETSNYIDDGKYSQQVEIPDVYELIEAGTYYLDYVSLLRDMYLECIHNALYSTGTEAGCPENYSTNWSFMSKFYSHYGADSNYRQHYANVCEPYDAASNIANYGGDAGTYAVWTTDCPAEYGLYYSTDYTTHHEAQCIKYTPDSCPTYDSCSEHYSGNWGAFFGSDHGSHGACPLQGYCTTDANYNRI